MNTKKKPILVVISYYDRRPLNNLYHLLDSIEKVDAGADYRVCVVTNRSSDDLPDIKHQSLELELLSRNNSGMNIGAWDFGWRADDSFEKVVFLQDDCFVVRSGWLKAFSERLDEPNVGMLGECLNGLWETSWEELKLREANVQLPEHLIDDAPANRIDVYQAFFAQHNIEPGNTAKHLRALCWGFRRDTLQKIDGFPIGNNFGECIAAEIAVSRKIEALGLRIETVHTNPFHYIRHLEWNQSEPGGDFSKLNVVGKELKHLRTENQQLSRALQEVNRVLKQPAWHLAKSIVSGNLKKQISGAIRKT